MRCHILCGTDQLLSGQMWAEHMLLSITHMTGLPTGFTDDVFLHPCRSQLCTLMKLFQLDLVTDRGVLAWREWLENLAGGGPFAGQKAEPERWLNGFSSPDRRTMLARDQQHTQNCTSCRQASPWQWMLIGFSVLSVAIDHCEQGWGSSLALKHMSAC